jgi:hypothetical protein
MYFLHHRKVQARIITSPAHAECGMCDGVPRNYPLILATNVGVPALLMGCAVLYKPSEHASATGRRIAQLLHMVRGWLLLQKEHGMQQRF